MLSVLPKNTTQCPGRGSNPDRSIWRPGGGRPAGYLQSVMELNLGPIKQIDVVTERAFEPDTSGLQDQHPTTRPHLPP